MVIEPDSFQMGVLGTQEGACEQSFAGSLAGFLWLIPFCHLHTQFICTLRTIDVARFNRDNITVAAITRVVQYKDFIVASGEI